MPCDAPRAARAPRSRGAARALAAAAVLLPLAWVFTAPAPALPPPVPPLPPGARAVADLLAPVYGAGRPVPLLPVPALLRPALPGERGDRVLVYRCEAPGPVGAVAVTTTAGDPVWTPLPAEPRDGAVPALVCDGTTRTAGVVLVATGSGGEAPPPGPSPVLLLAREVPPR
ncbi:hypothetical protein [Kineococcus sp. SYSU DK004]|uniref:hypothetical protein n=1 Tax=Kineococcus sp. SYSU DK004 TaxID=3383125 RepID=UPI003D7EBCA2